MIPDPLPWCDIVDLRLEAALSPGVPMRWGPLPPDEIDDSRLDYGRVFGPWDIPPGTPTDSLWLDISEALVSVTWTGGSASSDTVFARWEAAQMQATFHDPDLILDPTNNLSPLNARTIPNTPVRIRGGYKIPPAIITPPGTTGTGPGRIESLPGAIQAQPDSDVRLTWEGAIASTGQGVSTIRMVNGAVQLRTDTARRPQALIALYDALDVAVTGTVTGVGAPVRYDYPMGLRVVWDSATTTLQLWSLHDWPYGDWLLEGQAVYPGHTVNPWPTGWQYHNAGNLGAYAANTTHQSVEFLIDGVNQWSFGAEQLRDQAPDATMILTAQGTPLNIVRIDPPAVPPITIDPEFHPAHPDEFAVLFGGFADSWTPQWAPNPIDRYTRLTATDGVRILSGFDPPAGSNTGNNDTAAQRVNRILNHADWPANQRDVMAGGVRLHPTQHAQPAWTELLLTADTDLGIVWLAPDGRLSYRPGSAVRAALSAPPVASFGCDGDDIITAASIQFDALSIRNLVTGHNGSGNPITGADEASAARYRFRSYKRTDLQMSNRADLADWVEYVLELGAEPRRHISQMAMEPTLAPRSFRWLMIPYPLESWAISWTPPGDNTAHVVREVVTAGGWVHTVTPDRWETVITSGILPPLPFLQKTPRGH